MSKMEVIVVATSATDQKEAEKIGTTLVKEKLVACAKWWPITSSYFWKGKQVTGPEYEMLLVARKSLFPKIEKRIRELHSYTVPQILEIPIERVHEPYKSWLLDQTTRSGHQAAP